MDFYEMDRHLINDEAPSEYFNAVSLPDKSPYEMLKKLKVTEQSKKHHPEGSVWNHTMLVVDEAAKVKFKSKNPRVFMWAALLHDIGKPAATKIRKGKITSYDHDKIGEKLSCEFLGHFGCDKDFVREVSSLVRWHMQVLFVVNGLPFADVKNMKRQTDISDVALLGLCDRLGRLGADKKEEEKNIDKFIQKTLN